LAQRQKEEKAVSAELAAELARAELMRQGMAAATWAAKMQALWMEIEVAASAEAAPERMAAKADSDREKLAGAAAPCAKVVQMAWAMVCAAVFVEVGVHQTLLAG
jgi:hypothetical protein